MGNTFFYRFKEKGPRKILVPQITLGTWFQMLATLPICFITIFTVYFQILGLNHMKEIPGWCLLINYSFIFFGVYNVLCTILYNPGISDKIFEKIHNRRFNIRTEIASNEISTERSGDSVIDSQRQFNASTLPMCNHCGIEKNGVTSHCGMCGICVEDMDHHCIFFGKCIARGNIDAFQHSIGLFLISTFFFLTLQFLEVFWSGKSEKDKND